MDNFDKKIHDLFAHDRNQPLPNELSWQKMSPGIYTKMKKRKRKPLLWLFLSGMGLALFTIVLYQNQTINDSNPINEKKVIAKPSASTITKEIQSDEVIRESKKQLKVRRESSYERAKKTFEQEKQIPKSSGKLNPMIKPVHESPIVKILNERTGLNNNILSNESKKLIRDNAIKEPSPFVKRNETAELSKNDLLAEKVAKQEVKTNAHEATNENTAFTQHDKKKIKQLAFAKPLLLLVNFTRHLESQALPVPSNIKERTEATLYSLSLLGGTVFSFGNKGIDNRNKYLSSLPGYHASLSFNRSLNSSWNLCVGLHADGLVNHFDFERSDLTLQQTKLTTFVNNAITGMPLTETRKDTTVTTPRYRKADYHNTIKSIGLSIDLAYSFPIANRINIVPSFGIQYNRVTAQSGQTLDIDTEFLAFGTNRKLYSSNLFGISAGVDIAYRISERLSLLIGARSIQSVNSWTNDYNFLGRKVSYSTGLKFGF